jgi:hypothetical protein
MGKIAAKKSEFDTYCVTNLSEICYTLRSKLCWFHIYLIMRFDTKTDHKYLHEKRGGTW